MATKRTIFKKLLSRALVVILLAAGFQAGEGVLANSANAAVAAIIEDGSNSSGWTAVGYDSSFPLIAASGGNPGSAFTFNKNTYVEKTFGTSGADFEDAKINLQVRFTANNDQFGIYWGTGSAGGQGVTNSLWIGTDQNPITGTRLSGLGGLTTNVPSPASYWHGIDGGISGTGSSSVTAGLWEINRWYDVEIDIGPTSTSYFVDSVLIQTKASVLPIANVVTMGLDDRNGWGFNNGVFVDNISITPAVPKFRATFQANGASGTMATQVSSVSANLSTNTYTKSGSTFVGWNTQADGTGTFYSSGDTYAFASDVTLFAQWSSDSVPVLFNTDGGSAVTSDSVPIGSAIQSAPTAPTKSGYTFGGWKATSGGAAVTFPYYPILSSGYEASVTAAALVDLGRYQNQGTWLPNTWYGPNRNTPWSTKDFVTYTDGRKYIAIRESNTSLLSNPTRLDGYYMIPLDTSVTLTAIWTADLHHVTYNLAGASGAIPTQNDVATASSFVTANAPTRIGYSFGGWSDGSVVTASTARYTADATDITLAAVWALNSYDVTFDPKNGTQASVVSVNHGSSAPEPLTPIWYGYNFVGWSETLNGAIANIASSIISAAKSFFGVWEQKSIAGLSAQQLGVPDTVAPSDTLDKSVSSNSGNITSLVKVPAGSLPSTFTVKVYTLSDNNLAEQALGSGNTYLISQVISWSNSADGTIQDTAAGKPIELTITSPAIKTGAKVFAILGNVTTLLATATQDGAVTVNFSTDPVIVVQAAPILPPSSTPNGGGGATPAPTASPTPTQSSTPTASPMPTTPPVAIARKSMNLIGFHPGSWQLTKSIKRALDAFVNSLAKPVRVSCVGYTSGPTVLRGDAKLAKLRGQEVCRYISVSAPSFLRVTFAGKTTKLPGAFYRRTTLNVSDFSN